MFGPDKNYVTISINDGIIKAAQASFGNLEKIARGSYAAGASAEDAGKALRTLLTPFNRKAPVICLVPASAVTAKIIEVPSSDPEEIKSIINLQASRHTPYSREEVLISYINLGVNTLNNTRLLLVIVHRDIVKEKIAIMEKAGLNIDRVLFITEAQARFYAKMLNLKKEAPATGIVDFAMNATTYMVLAKGTLLFVRYIPIGIKALMQGPDAIGKLQAEFKKSMDAFVQEDGNEAPISYTVTADSQAVKNILPSLKEGMGIEFQTHSFLSFIKCPGEVRKKLQGFDDDSFLDVVAPAMTGGKCEINLMPEEMILKRTVDRQSKEVSKSGVAAVIIMFLIGAMIMSNLYFKDTFLNKNLKERYAPQKQEVQKLQAEMNKIKLVRDYIKGRMSSLDVLHDLSAITPHTVYLNNIMVQEDGTITIDGIADSMSLVYSYVKTIGDSSVFKEPKLKTASTKKDNGKDVAAFEIEFKKEQQA